MYRAFYQLNQNIHRKDRRGDDLFVSKSFAEAASRLDFMKDKGGIVLFTGLAGVGKTTTLRYFIEKQNPKLFRFAYAPLSTVSVIEFYRQIAILLGCDTPYRKDRLFYSIQETITDLAKNHQTTPVIIFDEAHLLKNDNFHELQILSNFSLDSADPALFILVAHPHIIDRLKRPLFDSFYQRIKLKISLPPFTLNETHDFISHILRRASATNGLFAPQAIELIHNLTNGLPRKITHLLEQTLIFGAANQLKLIDEEAIVQIAKEI